METKRKHQPLPKVTEVLLKNCMHSYSAHSNSAVKGSTVLKVYNQKRKSVESQKSTFLNTWNIAGVILS